MNTVVKDRTLEDDINEAEVVADIQTNSVKISDGSTVAIRKCKAKHIAPVLRLLKEAMGRMGMGTVEEAESAIDTNNIPELMDLLVDLSDSTFTVISLMTDRDEGGIGDLDMEDVFTVAEAVWELNKPFFLSKVLPLLRAR
jgi:hypothetical protein